MTPTWKYMTLWATNGEWGDDDTGKRLTKLSFEGWEVSHIAAAPDNVHELHYIFVLLRRPNTTEVSEEEDSR